jgi:hypothetical protein
MKTSNTIEHLQAIKNAMDKIKPIDQSDYFRQYHSEIKERLEELKRLETANGANN